MARYKRKKGGNKTRLTGVAYNRKELEKVYELYIELDGKGIHENNPKIHDLAEELERDVRSVENQLLGYKIVDTGKVGRANYNKLIKKIWEEKREELEGDLKYRVSAALKDIIGRDLITDDYIAVFELVKNSYDAYARNVDIYFKNIYKDDPQIIIKDDGKGMDKRDLLNKWLFVAYSAKREGTEDDSFDYRDEIYQNRPFAGAKGIGRFSCDRLGKKLYLETTKKVTNSKTEILRTDWEDFEKDLKDEFVDINVEHETKKEKEKHGTKLVISELRSNWDRQKILKLKSSLSKLINPNIGGKKKGKDFRISIHCNEELDNDESKEEDYEIVNGEVKNFIFETLGLKTTKIKSTISDDGKQVETVLKDGGTLIYKIKEDSEYRLLGGVSYTLYYLNQSAKLTFARRMGLPSLRYGHVFLYKNGFRVYPYGEPGEDPLKVDVRKAQGYARHIGNRELIGQIDITSDSDQLKETSSRGDGLIRTEAYYQLEEYFWVVLRRLEKYVVEVQEWGLSIEDIDSKSVEVKASKLIAALTGNNNVIEFQVSDKFTEILESSQEDSAKAIVENLTKIANESGDEKLIKEAQKANDKFEQIQQARIQAEDLADQETKKAKKATEKLKEQVSENLFLKSINTSDYEEVISLLHHIGIYSGTIENNLKGISLRIQNDIELTKDELYGIIRAISFENKKILNVVAFATKAKFKLQTEEIQVDMNKYIVEYIQNIVPTIADKDLVIEIDKGTDDEVVRRLKPIELNIVIDNLVSNARKAGATKLVISLRKNEVGSFQLIFKDNGRGISEKHIGDIYNIGFTTTDGSGVGLYHVKNIIESMNSEIEAKNYQDGAIFTITFK